jgi:hypothetical protein
VVLKHDFSCRQQEKVKELCLIASSQRKGNQSSGIMPPRRHRDLNPEMEEEMRRLRMRLDAMETTQRRAPDVGDVSEDESEEVEEEGVAEGEPAGRTTAKSCFENRSQRKNRSPDV